MSKIPAVVMKFGGSCFKDPAAFERIVQITDLYNKYKKVYVCSALKGITDKLVKVCEHAKDHNSQGVFDTLKEIEKKHSDTIEAIFNGKDELKKKANKFISKKISSINSIVLEIEEFGIEPYFSDYVLSYGEKLSTYLLHMYLKMKGYNTEYFVGEDLIITNDNFTDALPNYKYTFNRVQDAMKPHIEKEADDKIFCVTGFIGRNKIGYTTTLGRGGSDFTATILARSLFEVCKNIEIEVILWKDVDGILTADPRFVQEPKLVKKLNYKEAAESAFFGAKILHPKCLAAIENQKIPVVIKNFENPEENVKFSVISDETEPGNLKGISTISEMSMISVTSGTLVNVPGVLGKIFTILGDNEISVSMVAQSSSEINTTFVVEKEVGQKAVDILSKHPDLQEWYSITKKNVGIIAVIGDEIHKSNSKIFHALGKHNINVIAVAQSSDDLNISIIVSSDNVQEAVCAINREFQ